MVDIFQYYTNLLSMVWTTLIYKCYTSVAVSFSTNYSNFPSTLADKSKFQCRPHLLATKTSAISIQTSDSNILENHVSCRLFFNYEEKCTKVCYTIKGLKIDRVIDATLSFCCKHVFSKYFKHKILDFQIWASYENYMLQSKRALTWGG